jgi:ankyrin repeat protein
VCYDATADSYSMCERLIQSGAGIDAADAEGCTPLHYAASGGHASLVALLLMYGAAAARQDAMGYTAQDYAVQSNHMEVVQLLFHTGSGEDDANANKAVEEKDTEATKEEEELAKASEDLWQEYIDPSSGCPYYYNLLTGETTWER